MGVDSKLTSVSRHVEVREVWARDLRQYQYLPTYGNPGPRKRSTSNKKAVKAVSSRSSSPSKSLPASPPGKAAQTAAASIAACSSRASNRKVSEHQRSGSRSSRISTEPTRSFRSKRGTPNNGKSSVALSSMQLSDQSPEAEPEDANQLCREAPVSLQAVEERLIKALARCESFSSTFQAPALPPPPPSSTFMSMRSAVALLLEEQEAAARTSGLASSSKRIGTKSATVGSSGSLGGADLGDEARDRRDEIEMSVQAMRESVVGLNPGCSIGAGPMERMSAVAPELLPVVAKLKKLMQEIHGVDRGNLTHRQRLQAGIKQLQHEFEQATRTITRRTRGAVKAVPLPAC